MGFFEARDSAEIIGRLTNQVHPLQPHPQHGMRINIQCAFVG
jgi:hypothetical protein